MVGAVEGRAAPDGGADARRGTRGTTRSGSRPGRSAASSGSAPRSSASTGWPSLKERELAAQQVPHPVDVLEVERLVQVEGLADPRHVLRLDAGVHGVDGARLARGQVDHGVGDDRDHEEQQQPLPERPAPGRSPCSLLSEVRRLLELLPAREPVAELARRATRAAARCARRRPARAPPSRSSGPRRWSACRRTGTCRAGRRRSGGGARGSARAGARGRTRGGSPRSAGPPRGSRSR